MGFLINTQCIKSCDLDACVEEAAQLAGEMDSSGFMQLPYVQLSAP